MYGQEVLGVRPIDDTLNQPDNGFSIYKAGGAILSGSPVIIDSSVPGGTQVIASTTGLSKEFVGVYTGQGGSGAATATTNLTGVAAASGDLLIKVQRRGVIYALSTNSGANIAVDDILDCATTAARLSKTGATALACHPPFAVALDANSTGTAVAIRAFLKACI